MDHQQKFEAPIGIWISLRFTRLTRLGRLLVFARPGSLAGLISTLELGCSESLAGLALAGSGSCFPPALGAVRACLGLCIPVAPLIVSGWPSAADQRALLRRRKAPKEKPGYGRSAAFSAIQVKKKSSFAALLSGVDVLSWAGR